MKISTIIKDEKVDAITIINRSDSIITGVNLDYASVYYGKTPPSQNVCKIEMENSRELECLIIMMTRALEMFKSHSKI